MSYHVLSLGAGVNSTALLHVLLDNNMPLDEVVFADTGAEKPETYKYLQEWIVPFLKERGMPYTVVRNKKTLIERCMGGHNLPDKVFRWSTRDFKIRPIEKHLKPKAPVHVYLGIAYDEIHRVKQSPREWITNSWPLVEKRITRNRCMQIISSKNWPVPVKSGCFFCPFASQKDWFDLATRHPELYEQAIRIEQNCSKYPNFALVKGGLEKYREVLLERQRKLEKDNVVFGKQSTLDVLSDECSGYCMT